MSLRAKLAAALALVFLTAGAAYAQNTMSCCEDCCCCEEMSAPTEGQ